MTGKDINKLDKIFEMAVSIRKDKNSLNNLNQNTLINGKKYIAARHNELEEKIGIFCAMCKELGLKNYISLLS